jgi:hypothetical protein
MERESAFFASVTILYLKLRSLANGLAKEGMEPGHSIVNAQVLISIPILSEPLGSAPFYLFLFSFSLADAVTIG